MNTFLKENFFKLMIGSSILILSIGVLLYIVTSTQTPPSANDKIIGEPIRIGKLEVAQFDFPKYMFWVEAVDACKALGSGWRLPTKSELNLLYKNMDKIGGFAPEGYWSRSRAEKSLGSIDKAWYQSFADGKQCSIGFSENTSLVRAVRTF